MVKEPWACLGVPSEFETFTGRARAVPRAWSLRHGAAQGGTVIFRYRLIIVRSICSPMIHLLIARSVHYPVVHFCTSIRFRSTEFPYLPFTKAFLPHSHFNTSCLNQRLAPASITRWMISFPMTPFREVALPVLKRVTIKMTRFPP